MTETITVLGSLLVISICATGTIFLKWIEAKKTITDMKKEIDRFQKENVDAQRKHETEMTNAKKAIGQLQASNVQLQRQRRRVNVIPM